MDISTNVFINKLGEALDNGIITNEQYDNYMYECAVAQAYDPDQLEGLMDGILTAITFINQGSETEEPQAEPTEA